VSFSSHSAAKDTSVTHYRPSNLIPLDRPHASDAPKVHNMEFINETRTSINSLRFFCICAPLFLCSGLHAQNSCGVEVKLLLSPIEVQAAVTALNGKKETPGFVYFFDTNTLDLLTQGVIVRLRRGSDNDLTVKLRPPNGKKFSDSATEQEVFKCEVDLIGDGANPAYSITRRYIGNPLPQTGYDISHLLSPGQKKLLEVSKASICWSRVKRIAEIWATAWRAKAQPLFNKITLELWEWPEGRILELSTKTGSDAGPMTYEQLQDLANSKSLSLSRDQRSKTRTVLESITHLPIR
jgi:hypothetical protein